MDQSQFCQAAGQFENQPQQQWQQQSSLDDVLQQILHESISTQKSIEASFKRMKMHIGPIVERLHDSRVDTKINPREECRIIITGSDKTLDEKKIERKEKEELSENDKGEFGERSEEGHKWNQKRHQKVQKEKPQPPLSGTQKPTLAPLRGAKAAEGRKPTHALTAERHFFRLGPNFL
ncbi:hypothetical protein LR48_Vigan07g144300 [Vigna angularis]|uniref:Uncharacterized protein n=1 Tax=Phaseolus angularis TaxID=3914 RepID=A0A0L9UYV4_PHAAN|nr:hypothetical protein LR48_Vigan07g144300 [Vigna angularis]